MGYYANDCEAPYEEFTSTIRINNLVSDNYEDINGDIIKARLISAINEKMYELFHESPFYDKYKDDKKIDKSELMDMYFYFRQKLIAETKYTLSQIFICFAEFFDVNYKILYGELCVLDKDMLIRELSESTNLRDKINKNKLF